RLPLTSWTATTSKWDTISVIMARARRSRLGLSAGPAAQVSARSPKARTFQVPMTRLRSRLLAGTVASRADRSPALSAATASGIGPGSAWCCTLALALGVAITRLPRREDRLDAGPILRRRAAQPGGGGQL